MFKRILKTLFLVTSVFTPAVAWGGTMSEKEAKEVAVRFFRDGAVHRLANVDALTVEYVRKDGTAPLYYVFNATDGEGFIIVSADDSDIPVIGYSTTSRWASNDVPAEAKQLADDAGARGRRISRMAPIYAAGAEKKVLPTATWSQESPFNNRIPNRRLVGCVGVALAEILKYHRYPAQRPSSLVESGETAIYDWEHMRDDNYRGGYDAMEADAVATLVADAAISIGTDFGMSSSSAFEVKVPAALVGMFGYDAGVSYKKGSEMDRDEWDNLIVNEINEGRPVLYCGQDVSAGHAFVCDGYQVMGGIPYLHINWGWGGSADGFYASDALNPTVSSSHSFNNLTTIVYNIKPAESASEWSPIHLTSDNRQIGMTTDVTALNPGMSFSVRAGALKNIMPDDFSGYVSAALFSSDGKLKGILGNGKRLNIASLQIVDYIDLACSVPDDVTVDDSDVVRLVTSPDGTSSWLPVANDLLTYGMAKARGYDIPYFDITIPAEVEGAVISYDDNRVIKGRDYSFGVVSSSPENVITVKANGFIISPDADNRYTLRNVTDNQDITIIVQNAADVISRRNLWVQAGKLSQLISDIDSGTITDLTLYGTIDATDFTFMRERMKLTRLDISEVSIVAQGVNPANAIPAKAFHSYRSLKQIILPRNLKTFKNGCFNNSGLTSIEIPASVATYEYNVFVNSNNLREVIVRRPSPAWVNWCVFHGTAKARLVVPPGASSAYRNKEYWKDFAEIIEEKQEPAASYNVIVQEAEGVKFSLLTESGQVAPGEKYRFKVETDERYGDAIMEMYANSTILRPDASGVYEAIINSNTLIHANFRQPAETGDTSPWKITAAAGGTGLVTDVVNVAPGKSFTIRANALAIPSDNAALFYCAALTDKDGRIKEIISPVVANSYYNHGNLPCNLTCQVKEASVREGNRIHVLSSFDKKKWSIVKAESDSVADHIDAIGNKVVYCNINMPSKVEGASISGAASQVVRGMPLNIKVTPVSVDDCITIAVNGVNRIVDAPVANLSIPAVLEDTDISIQVVPLGADAYNVVNVREGELAEKIAVCPSRLKITGVMRSEDFDAIRAHAGEIADLDLADVTIKGTGDLANAIPSNAFASSQSTQSTALSRIILPSGLVNIEANAFNRCVNLTEITIPASVTYIGSNAFTACVNLRKVAALGNQPPATGSMNPFPGHTGIKLEVPKNAEQDYNSATFWKDLMVSAAATYFNIQIDQERIFNYNEHYTLTKILYTGSKIQVTLGLPNFEPTGYKDNPAYHPSTAFKLYDNDKDVTYTSSYLKYGQYSVVFDGSYGSASIRYPQNHVIDVVFHYPINFKTPEGLVPEFVDLDSDDRWENVKLQLFVPGSQQTPTLYREGRDYKFRFGDKLSNVELSVTAKSRILTTPGDNPSYRTVEQVLMPDENGVYTLANLQGNTDITVTSCLVIEDGDIITPDDIRIVDASDAANISSIGVSGEADEETFRQIREKFNAVETLNLSEISNGAIPDNAFRDMESLRNVVIPDNVMSIGDNAFAGCCNLESLTLPSVEAIGEDAFEGCSALTSISILGTGNGTSAANERMNAPRTSGISGKSFNGLNPNCLIYIPEGFNCPDSVRNVVVNTSHARVATGDISLSADYPFNAPASFSLADNSISLTVNIPGSISDDNDRWRGLVIPFTPDSYESGKEFTPRDGTVLTTLSFDSTDDSSLISQSGFVANRPYLINAHAPFDFLPVTFQAKGKSTDTETVYDISFTPTPEELTAVGKDFSLFGSFTTGGHEGGVYMLDETGAAFNRISTDTVVSPFSVYLRANTSSAPETLNVGTHPIWIVNPVASTESGAELYRSSAIGLTSPSAKAEILYTTDGTDPSVSGTVYTEPLKLPGDSITLRAVARYKGHMSDIVDLHYSLRKTHLGYRFEEGWNWISHNMENPLPVENIMGNDVDRILSQTQEVIRDPQLGVVGSLSSLDPLEAYKVFVTEGSSDKSVSGISFDPSATVTLHKGWNWIGCPVEDMALPVADLFSNLEAEEGDMILGRDGFIQADADGKWIGDLSSLCLGKGYMFLSGSDKEFVYNISSTLPYVPANVERLASGSPWNVVSSPYPSVMPLTARIMDGSLPAGNGEYEIGAFCGDECRGVGVVVDGYMMISVFGNPGDKITFRTHSNVTHMDSRLCQEIMFSDDPVGSLREPYVFDISSTSSADGVHAGSYDIIIGNGSISVNGDAGDIYGVDIFTESGVRIYGAPSGFCEVNVSKGVYVVTITTSNGKICHKIMVK